MKPTKKVGVLLLASYLVLEAATTLMQVNLSAMERIVSFVAIAAAVFLFLDR